MSQTDDVDQAAPFDPSELGSKFGAAKSEGRVFLVQGLSAGQIVNETSALRERLDQQGLLLFRFNPRSGEASEHSLESIVRDYIREVDRRDGLTDEALRLAEIFQSSNDAKGAVAGRQRAGTLGRLWTELSRIRPAVLLVLHPAQAPDADRERLKFLTRYVFADPIGALAPEVGSREQANGALVFIGDESMVPFDVADLDVERLDYREASQASIREFLASEDVVRRFAESTGGDLDRLNQFVENLPKNTHHLLLYRFDRLEPQERAILEALSVADRPVSPALLHNAVTLLGASEYFTRSLRGLVDGGMVRRSIGAGDIVVDVEDEDFAEALRAGMENDRGREVHLALANAERVTNEDAPEAAFLARHYLAGGADEDGLEWGLRAVRKLHAGRSYDRARGLLKRLLDVASDDDVVLELHNRLVDVFVASGDYREALKHCGLMRPLIDDDDEQARLRVRTGRLLNRISEYDAAVERFDEALELTEEPSTLTDGRLGKSQADYALGRHAELVEEMEELAATLAEERESCATSERNRLDRALIEARNLIGKVCIYRSEYERATELFEANRVLASRWGWDEEMARSQANLGVVSLQQNQHADALDRLRSALETSSARESLPRAYCLVNLAAVHQRRDDYGEALEHCLEAMRAARRAGDDHAYNVASRNLATIYEDVGAYERAHAIVEHLRDWYEADAHTLGGGWNLLVRGQLSIDQRDFDGAIDIFDRLLHSDLKSVFGAEAELRLAEAKLALGHRDAAEELLEDYEKSEGHGDADLLNSLEKLIEAELALEDAEFEEARDLAREAHGVLRRIGEKNEPVRARMIVARALLEMDRVDEARSELQRELRDIVEIAENVPERFRNDFFAKPVHRDLVGMLRELEGDVPSSFDTAIEMAGAEEEDVAAPEGDPEYRRWRQQYGEIVGEDPRLLQVFRTIDRVADSDAPVLVYGESGTGKELVAESLHEQSGRSSGPFVRVNCAAFVENLLLSELFGHEKGAFTGAVGQKIGRFERADGGTIFLDEIGDISPNTQVALLRVLQEGEFERVGGSETMHVDVRVVCATNKNLEELVQRGEFRLDLYYRLKGVVMELPPLRERRQDIPRLVAHFARTYSHGATKRFAPDVLRFLASYSWPGNIRELQNFVKSVLLFVEGDRVEMRHVDEFGDFFVSGDVDPSLPEIDVDVVDFNNEDVAELEDIPGMDVVPENVSFASAEGALVEKIVGEGRSLSDIKKRIELECIKRALVETEGNVTRAAEILQMGRPRLSQIINSTDELVELKEELVS